MPTAVAVQPCRHPAAAVAAARPAPVLLVLMLVCCLVSATAAVTAAAAASDSTTCGSSGSSSGSCRQPGPAAAVPAAVAAHSSSQGAEHWTGPDHSAGSDATAAHARRLLQGSSVSTACGSRSGSSAGNKAGSSSSSTLDAAAVQQIAQRLLGDSRLQVTHARFTGSCRALGAASFAPPSVFAGMFPAAVVLSTGDAQQAAGDGLQESGRMLSTDLQQAGDASIGAYTQDAAVLEAELTTGPNVGTDQQLVLSYLFASEEYGTKTPNPDVLSLTLTPHTSRSSNSGGGGGAATADLAVLPGGEHLQPPAVADGAAMPAVKVFSNAAGRYRTVFNGFTQVVPSQGFSIQPSSSYTLRLAVADAHHGLVDSVLMVPAGAVRLAAAPTAAHGGPYAVAPNSKLSLRGEKSSSRNGAILSYRWSISPAAGSSDGSSGGPSSSDGRGGGVDPVLTASGASAVVNTPPPGQYKVTLEVWDTVGAYAAATTALSVDPNNVLSWWSSNPGFAAQAPAVAPRPVAVLSVNGSRAETLAVKARSDAPAVVDLDGSASRDSKGTLLVFSWSVTQTDPVVKAVDVLVGLAQPPRLLQSLDPGVYLVTLDATGPGGTSSKQVLLTVAANSPPVAMPGGPYVATVGKPVFIDGSGSSDPDGDPLSYSWTLSRDGTVIGRYNSTSLSMTLNRPGAYTVQLTVRDDRGGVSSASAELNSYITAPPPPPPTQQAPAAPQRSVASIPMAPAAAAAAALSAAPPNARTASAASISQAMQPSELGQAVPYGWGSQAAAAGGAPFGSATGAAADYYPAAGGAVAQPTAYAPGLLQQLQVPQQQQLAVPPNQQAAFQLPYQQQQQQLYQQMLPQQQQLQFPAGAMPEQAVAGVPGAEAAAMQQGSALPGAAGPGAAAVAPGQLPTGMPQQQLLSATPTGRTVGMCLFKDGKPDYNPADAQAALKGLLPNSNWAPCPLNTGMFSNAPTGIPAAPALDPPAPPAAAAAAAPAAPTAPAAPAQLTAAVAAASAADAGAAGDNTGGTSSSDGSSGSSGSSGTSSSDGSSGSSGSSGVGAAEVLRAVEAAQSTAVIKAPESFVKAEGAVTQVYLDAAGSAAAPERSIVAYRWTVHSKADGSVVTSVSGQRTPVWLGPGEYSLKLQVTDTAGQLAVADKAFAVGDVAATVAHISSPSGFIQVSDGGSVEVQLSASGSQAGPGRSIISYNWTVIRLPDNSQVATGSGPLATAALASGSYEVQLAVSDSSGGAATAKQGLCVGGKGSTGATAVIAWPPTVVHAVAADAAAAVDAAGIEAAEAAEFAEQEAEEAAGSSSGGDGKSLVTLDAFGSAPSRADGTIREHVWAVLSMPSKTPVANATGRVATVRVPPGSYQVGLLVLDADGGTAAARKNIVVQEGPANNRPPVITPGLRLSGSPGSNVSISGVSDPDGDAVRVSWSLVDQVSGLTVTGQGLEVPLAAGLNPGGYLLLVTAADGRGGEASGTLQLTVTGKQDAAGAAAAAAAAASRAATPRSSGSKHRAGRADAAKVSIAAAPTHGSSSSSSRGQRDGNSSKHKGADAAASTADDNSSGGGGNSKGSGSGSGSGSSKGSKQHATQASTPPAGAATAAAGGAAEGASIFQGPSGPKKLPVLSMPQGSVLVLDAAAFALAPPGTEAKSYVWELQQRGTGQQVSTVYGRMGRFELSKLDAYNIRLLATDTQGRVYASPGSVRVLDPPSEGEGVAGALLRPDFGGSVVQTEGQCGPFRAQQYAAAVLECPELQMQPLEPSSLHWAWRVTLISQSHKANSAGNNSSSSLQQQRDESAEEEDEPDDNKSSSRGTNGSARGSKGRSGNGGSSSNNSGSRTGGPRRQQVVLGRSATLLGLTPGTYRVELAVGVGGPPSSRNTAYYQATLLHVAPTKGLDVHVPSTAVCAGQPITLEAPQLQLALGDPQPELRWQVTMEQSLAALFAAGSRRPAATVTAAATAAAAAASSSGSNAADFAMSSEASAVIKGAGMSFGFTLQPGRYVVQLTAHMPDGSSISGSGVVKAKACVGCKPGPVEVVLPKGTCAAHDAQAQLVMNGPLPEGLEVEWANGTDTSPGSRAVTVVAKLPGALQASSPGAASKPAPGSQAGATSSAANKVPLRVPSCGAFVHFRDEEAPKLKPLHEAGLCLAPTNSRWSCWHAHQLVSISDNCGSGAELAFRVSCGSADSSNDASSSSGSSESSSSSSDDCQVLPDGRVCVRAAAAGQVSLLEVTARDGSGNLAEPVSIPVRVLAAPTQHRECSRPEWAQPLLQPFVAAVKAA